MVQHTVVYAEPGHGAAVIARGRIYPAGQPALDVRVTLEIDERRATLESSTGTLGSWPRAAVVITRGDDGHFRFGAEGDEMVFVVDRPSIAARLDAFLGPVVDEPKRTRQRRRRRRTVRNTNEKAAEKATSTPRAPAVRKRRRKLSVTPPRTNVQNEPAVPAREPEPPTDDLPEAPPAPEPAAGRAAEAATVRPAHPPRVESSAEGDEAPAELASAGGRRLRTWLRRRTKLGALWLMEHLRQTDIYVLDRIPVVTDEMRLDGAHEHTYERRAAFPGTVREICTGCGKVHLTPAAGNIDQNGESLGADGSDTTSNESGTTVSRPALSEPEPAVTPNRTEALLDFTPEAGAET